LIEIQDLNIRRGGRVICSVDRLHVSCGRRVGIVGSNGAGKSTLLRVLAGLEGDFSGTCKVNTGKRERVYVDQRPFLFTGTVLTNVMYGPRARGVGRRAARKSAMAWLEKLGMTDLASARVHRLSGGERRRTALAAALAVEPPLLTLDEPLADMDRDGVTRLGKILGDLTDATVVIASPLPLPEGLVDRTYELQKP
jgi:energy-coupling factor transporter ATP-binding protein EcfA2